MRKQRILSKKEVVEKYLVRNGAVISAFWFDANYLKRARKRFVEQMLKERRTDEKSWG